MGIYYSEETKGFYVEDVHGTNMPNDIIAVPDETYAAMMDGQRLGKIIALVDGELKLCEPSVDKSLQRYALDVAARRYLEEVSGICFDGFSISTSREGQFQIASAALGALQIENYKCQWKTTNGYFVEVDAQKLNAIASAVRAHVQACFDREAELLAHLEAGTFEESMLDQGWPA